MSRFFLEKQLFLEASPKEDRDGKQKKSQGGKVNSSKKSSLLLPQKGFLHAISYTPPHALFFLHPHGRCDLT